MSTHQADPRADNGAIEVAVPPKAAVSSVAQWITYTAVELCRCCFGTAAASDPCGACHGKTVMSGRRTVKAQLPAGIRDGQLLTLPRLVDHYPDRLVDLHVRIRLRPQSAPRPCLHVERRPPCLRGDHPAPSSRAWRELGRPASRAAPACRLGKRGQLHAQGMLTDEEFDAAKQKILGDLWPAGGRMQLPSRLLA